MMTLTILGVTGSIGKQTLEVLTTRNDYELIAVSCFKNKSELRLILDKFKTIKFAYIFDKNDADELKKIFSEIEFFYGENGLVDLVKKANSDVYVNSVLGFAGLIPSLKIIELDKILLLANKESLVVGGDLIKKALKKHKCSKLIPIDSEHVAISKCLEFGSKKDIIELVITASGGKFFELKREELKNIKHSEAFGHPNWNMGQKITIDSNTMMNKTFELIEAFYLFDVPFKKIKAIVNRESYVHGLIKFKEKTILQVSKPTMLEPIKYALDFYKDKPLKREDCEENTYSKYVFHELDYSRFPLLNFAEFVVKHRGDAGCVLNACDEEAVKLFVENKIEFYQIELIVDLVMKSHKFRKFVNINDLIKTDQEVREETRKIVEEL